MNRFIFLFTLFYNTFFFAQKAVSITDTIQVKKDFFKIYYYDLPLTKNTFDFKLVNYKESQLSVYNSFSMSNDVCFLQDGNYYRANPRLYLENNFRSSKVDSFNPHGSSNIGSAIVLGMINVFMDKL